MKKCIRLRRKRRGLRACSNGVSIPLGLHPGIPSRLTPVWRDFGALVGGLSSCAEIGLTTPETQWGVEEWLGVLDYVYRV